MKRIIIPLALLVLVISAAFAYKEGTVNVLTPAEKKQGYKLLFDGKSLNGWRTYQNKKSDSWSVNNGTLYCTSNANGIIILFISY